MQIAVYLVNTHLLLYDNGSVSLILHFKQCTTLGLLETTTQLRQSIADVYFMYILHLSLQLFFKLLFLLLVKGKFSEFWRTNSSRSTLLPAKVSDVLTCALC